MVRKGMHANSTRVRIMDLLLQFEHMNMEMVFTRSEMYGVLIDLDVTEPTIDRTLFRMVNDGLIGTIPPPRDEMALGVEGSWVVPRDIGARWDRWREGDDLEQVVPLAMSVPATADTSQLAGKTVRRTNVTRRDPRLYPQTVEAVPKRRPVEPPAEPPEPEEPTESLAYAVYLLRLEPEAKPCGRCGGSGKITRPVTKRNVSELLFGAESGGWPAVPARIRALRFSRLKALSIVTGRTIEDLGEGLEQLANLIIEEQT